MSVHDLVMKSPSVDDIDAYAPALATAYNDFAYLLGNTQEMEPDDVRDFFASMRAAGNHAFLFFEAGELVADGDLRDIVNGEAEIALTVLQRSQHRRGIGRAVVRLLERFAFCELRLHGVRAEILRHNEASLGLFRSLGYQPDARTKEHNVILTMASRAAVAALG